MGVDTRCGVYEGIKAVFLDSRDEDGDPCPLFIQHDTTPDSPGPGGSVVIGRATPTGGSPEFSLPGNLLNVVKSQAAGSYVMANFEYWDESVGGDSGTLRAIAYAVKPGPSSSVRAAEFHVNRGAGAASAGSWGMEIGVHVQRTTGAQNDAVGGYMWSGSSDPAFPCIMADTGWLVGGDQGFHYPYAANAPANAPLAGERVFDVATLGQGWFRGGVLLGSPHDGRPALRVKDQLHNWTITRVPLPGTVALPSAAGGLLLGELGGTLVGLPYFLLAPT